jgi:maltose-binding protein MalE
MCILCDLHTINGKTPAQQDRERAICYVDSVIKDCEKLAFFYRQIRDGTITPHTPQMRTVVDCEKSLMRKIITDIL